jgi:hypothetical protein
MIQVRDALKPHRGEVSQIKIPNSNDVTWLEFRISFNRISFRYFA